MVAVVSLVLLVVVAFRLDRRERRSRDLTGYRLRLYGFNVAIEICGSPLLYACGVGILKTTCLFRPDHEITVSIETATLQQYCVQVPKCKAAYLVNLASVQAFWTGMRDEETMLDPG
jgi:hypothetical protein